MPFKGNEGVLNVQVKIVSGLLDIGVVPVGPVKVKLDFQVRGFRKVVSEASNYVTAILVFRYFIKGNTSARGRKCKERGGLPCKKVPFQGEFVVEARIKVHSETATAHLPVIVGVMSRPGLE